MNLLIKEEFKQTVVAFGNSGLPLGMLTADKVLDLAIIARESNSPSMIRYFKEPLPSLEDLRKARVDVKLNEIKKEIVPAAAAEKKDENKA